MDSLRNAAMIIGMIYMIVIHVTLVVAFQLGWF